MSESERAEKESFRLALDQVCRDVCAANSHLPTVSLECFGSFRSGFASAGSDMDLVIVIQGQGHQPADSCFSIMEHDLPRSLEKELLRKGFGARLLTQTRVPIIKICQDPGDSLLGKLRESRDEWDSFSDEKKYPHLYKGADENEEGETSAAQGTGHAAQPSTNGVGEHKSEIATEKTSSANGTDQAATPAATTNGGPTDQAKRDQNRGWTRERKSGPLDFPKDGVGIQCDINFFNPLGLHNTQMLRCYSMCDPRVRPMVLFVKSWAKQRKINSSYSGTLSSYGYVMMVLHYLMNVAQPPVLPNLQLPWRPNTKCTPPGYNRTEIDGWTVEFWRNEEEIQDALRAGQMSSNKESLGSLLAGFFQYYSSMGNGPQFRWTQWVLSLRTPQGIMTKDSKGWVKAITEEGEGKRIQHRYLFCIEDPFELSHNVARTVTHNGIVAIRDEFRRAYRILLSMGQGIPSHEGELFAPLVEVENTKKDVPAANASNVDEASAKTNPMPPMNKQTEAPPSNNPIHPQQPQRNGSASDTKSTHSRQNSQPAAKPKPKQSLDVQDQDSFPSLSDAKSAPNNRRQKSVGGSAAGKVQNVNFNEISGDQAAAYLEEFRRKKAEAQAESTAHGIAESVLSGDDD